MPLAHPAMWKIDYRHFNLIGKKANDKGKVEGLARYSRANFLMPVPHAPSIEALDARLAERRLARQKERAGRHELTILERLAADKAMFRELPATPFEPCHKVATIVSSLSLVRYRTNDYSVPTRYGFRDVLAKGFVDEIAIFCDGVEIARHTRSYAWRRRHLHAGHEVWR